MLLKSYFKNTRRSGAIPDSAYFFSVYTAFVEGQQWVCEIDEWLSVHKAQVNTLANAPSLKLMDWTSAFPYLDAEIERMSLCRILA